MVDLGPALCPGPVCSTERGGNWVFKDESHISVGSSERMAPILEEAMLVALG
ncbi:MAG: hypothetical protein H6519_05685 [Microthrixaceae bacterium]|nr:hypothetical protein [Acidimicrobiales bacterium]MCB9403910.1 hypothetical protein [Microthrixaceae bacterium]